MKIIFAVVALIAGAAALSLPRDGNSNKCHLSKQGKEAVATMQALITALADFGANTLSKLPTDGTATEADIEPLLSGEKMVAVHYTDVANAIDCIPTNGKTTDCDFT